MVWCYSFFAQPNDHMATQHHHLYTSWASSKQPHSSPFVPAQYVKTLILHKYSWCGETKLTMETSPGFCSSSVDQGRSWIKIIGDGYIPLGCYLLESHRTFLDIISVDHSAFWDVDLTGGRRCSCFLLTSFYPCLQHTDCCYYSTTIQILRLHTASP